MWIPLRLFSRSLCHHRFITVWKGHDAVDICLLCKRRVEPPAAWTAGDNERTKGRSVRAEALCNALGSSLPTITKTFGVI